MIAVEVVEITGVVAAAGAPEAGPGTVKILLAVGVAVAPDSPFPAARTGAVVALGPADDISPLGLPVALTIVAGIGVTTNTVAGCTRSVSQITPTRAIRSSRVNDPAATPHLDDCTP
jgi:hypothetical protein